MDFTRKLSFLVFLLCVLISLKNQNAETNRKSSFQNADYSSINSRLLLGAPSAQRNLQENDSHDNALHEWLRYDYYNESCPLAEQIIRSTVQELFKLRHNVAPALLRLVFHDCFVEVTFFLFYFLVSIFRYLFVGLFLFSHLMPFGC